MSKLEDTTEMNISRLKIMLAVWRAELDRDKDIIDALSVKRLLTRPETRVIK
jgi:hypothetical protein